MKKSMLLAITLFFGLSSFSQSQIQDSDGDTKVQTEAGADEDIIRFETEGVERWRMDESRLEPASFQIRIGQTGVGAFITATGTNHGGGGVYLGHNAGQFSIASATFVGTAAGARSVNPNLAIGEYALAENIDGTANSAVGIKALFRNQGSYNTAVGWDSMKKNQFGSHNTATGTFSLYSNENGQSNTAIGRSSMSDNRNGNENTAVGNHALHENLNASFNTAIGSFSLGSNTAGHRNTATGHGSLRSNATGQRNSAYGASSLSDIINGYENSAFGNESMAHAENGIENSAFGSNTLRNNDGSRNTAVGSGALYWNRAASQNTALGHSSLGSNLVGENNTAAGFNSMATNRTGEDNAAFGVNALATQVEGYRNCAFGPEAMVEADEGSHNSAFGNRALAANRGEENTAVGSEALLENTAGRQNTAVGFQSMKSNREGVYNTAHGALALAENTVGSANTGIGFRSLEQNDNGVANSANGYKSLNNNKNGKENSAFGYAALLKNVNGAFNTGVGSQSNALGTGLINTTGIGFRANCTADNQVRIGNNWVTSIGGYVGWTNLSDKRFKKNIEEDVKGLEFIQRLRPVTYSIDQSSIERFYTKNYGAKDSIDWNSKNEIEELRFTGFLAQEVEEAAKEVGFDFSGVDAPKNEKDYYGLRYAEFVVPLVKAVQELSQKVEEKELSNSIDQDADEVDEIVAQLMERVNELTKQVDNLKSRQETMDTDLQHCCLAHQESGVSGNSFSDPFETMKAQLEQNAPNPFNESTEIKFYIPQGVLISQLMITDLSGNILQHFDITEQGFGSVRIEGGSLAKGTYIYTLYTDGEKVGSKQMIVI